MGFILDYFACAPGTEIAAYEAMTTGRRPGLWARLRGQKPMTVAEAREQYALLSLHRIDHEVLALIATAAGVSPPIERLTDEGEDMTFRLPDALVERLASADEDALEEIGMKWIALWREDLMSYGSEKTREARLEGCTWDEWEEPFNELAALASFARERGWGVYLRLIV